MFLQILYSGLLRNHTHDAGLILYGCMLGNNLQMNLAESQYPSTVADKTYDNIHCKNCMEMLIVSKAHLLFLPETQRCRLGSLSTKLNSRSKTQHTQIAPSIKKITLSH